MPLKHKLRPTPEYLKQRRHFVRHNEHTRFYGLYNDLHGHPKRFSFQVNLAGVDKRERYRMIVRTTNELLDGRVPEHEQGQVFSSFGELLNRTDWFTVRSIIDYKVKVFYER